MRLAIASCWTYRDAWKPFLALLDKFWPTHPPVDLITDIYIPDGLESRWRVRLFLAGQSATWCQALAKYASAMKEPILVMQEDFFLTAPVNELLVMRAEALISFADVGCVRLYPCPGSDALSDDKYYGNVGHDADYRISCQAAMWKPEYLKRIADQAIGSAASFEIGGTEYSRAQPERIMAFRRELTPWPMQYICSGISRGMWNPDSKKLCDLYGIENDWSRRPFAS